MGGGTSLLMALGNKQTDLHGFYDLSSSIDKVSLKRNSMSLGLVVLEEKLFTWTPQSDAIMSADKSPDIKAGILRKKVIKSIPLT